MRYVWVGVRLVTISFLLWWALFIYLARRLRRGRIDRTERERLRGAVFAELLERLGAAFIKLGQILSTRPDLLGPGYIEHLARLQDQVPPVSSSAIRRVLADELGTKQARLRSFEEQPIAAASVAQVHKAQLQNGEIIALKIQRPNVERIIDRDLSIMRLWARLINLLPTAKLLNIPGAIHEFGVALRGQLDFCLEAENNRRFAANFAAVDYLRVPTLVDELCTRRVLAMEFIDGVRGSEPERVGGDRKLFAQRGAEAILKMVFVDGFVHADLHPGNIILTPDGQVVVIDLGMIAEIPKEMMRPWIETFNALALRDGRKAAQMLYSYSPSVSIKNYAQFEAEVMAYFEQYYGMTVGEVQITKAIGGVLALLRRHRIKVDAAFTVVNIALLVAEGLGKQLDPALDMTRLALPYLAQAIAEAPEGRKPYRLPPTTTPDKEE